MSDYCTDADVKNACPLGMREDPRLISEISYWKQPAQAYIDELLSKEYNVPLTGTIPVNVRYATALMTVSLLIGTAFTQYDIQEQQDEKVISLAQLKESQAIKLIKNLIAGNYINPELAKAESESSPVSFMSLSFNPLRNIVDSHINKVSSNRFV